MEDRGVCRRPPGLGAADDLEAVIVDFIAGARSKLSIAVQELDSEAIARAILDASWRGVHVELFLEQDYLRTSLKRESGVPIKPVPEVGETPEQALADARRLQPEDLPPEVHSPRLLRRQGDIAGNTALLSGSANFTVTDTHVNLNHVRLPHRSSAASTRSSSTNFVAEASDASVMATFRRPTTSLAFR